MAPRPLETRDHFLTRLAQGVAAGAMEIRFGGHHLTHAVCLEDGVFRVRRLECSPEEAEAYLAEHGMFMPEHAEEISKPGTAVFEASTLDELERLLSSGPWPL